MLALAYEREAERNVDIEGSRGPLGWNRRKGFRR